MQKNIIFTIMIPIFLYTFYSFGVIIKTISNIFLNNYDELEKKAIWDSLAISMIIIVVIHLLQLVTSMFIIDYMPIVTPVKVGEAINGVIGGRIIFNAFFFDCFIISIIYNLNRYTFGLISKKQVLIPIITIFCLILIVGIIVLFS